MSAREDERKAAERADMDDRIGRVEAAIKAREVEDAEYAKDFDGTVPEVPKGKFDEYEYPERFGQEFQWVSEHVSTLEPLAEHAHIARERLALSQVEKRSHHAELVKLKAERKKL